MVQCFKNEFWVDKISYPCFLGGWPRFLGILAPLNLHSQIRQDTCWLRTWHNIFTWNMYWWWFVVIFAQYNLFVVQWFLLFVAYTMNSIRNAVLYMNMWLVIYDNRIHLIHLHDKIRIGQISLKEFLLVTKDLISLWPVNWTRVAMTNLYVKYICFCVEWLS